MVFPSIFYPEVGRMVIGWWKTMLESIYQKLIILGFSETVIIVAVLIICFFAFFLIIRQIVYYLIKYRCDNLIACLVSCLLIFSLANKLLEQHIALNSRVYLYAFSLAISLITIQLMFKKITEKRR